MYEITGGLVPPVFVFRQPQIIWLIVKVNATTTEKMQQLQ